MTSESARRKPPVHPALDPLVDMPRCRPIDLRLLQVVHMDRDR